MQKRNVLLASMMLCMLIFTTACKEESDKKDKTTASSEAANTEQEAEVKEAPPPTKKEIGHAFGVIMGRYVRDAKLEIDYNQVLRGLKESVANKDADVEGAQNIIQRAVEHAHKLEAEKNAKAEAEFLEKNAKLPTIKTTESGLQYEVIVEGQGERPSSDDTVKVHYKGTLLDGTEFDSSYKRDKPVEFPLRAVISGWREGLQLMNVGAKYKLYIPSKIGYGEQGVPQVIPPNSLLTFEVELLEIMPQPKDEEKK